MTPPWPARGGACRRRSPQPLQPGAEGRVVDVERQREDLARDLRGDAEDREVVVGRVDAQRLVELRPHVVAHVHGGEDREQEEA